MIGNTHINALLCIKTLKPDSVKDLRNLIDTMKNIRAFQLLKLETNDLIHALLINIIMNKLDPESRKSFETSLITKELPSWSEFIEYLQKR